MDKGQPSNSNPASKYSRFLSLIGEPEQRTECKHWLGAIATNGYGTFWFEHKKQLAHRIAYEIAYGPIPIGLFVCHVCDNPCCCNPRHLFLGTHQQNMDDCKAKGRSNRGTKQNSAKLKDEQVMSIRVRYRFRKVTSIMLCKEFGIAQPTLSAIINNQTWRHLPPCITNNNYIKQRTQLT